MRVPFRFLAAAMLMAAFMSGCSCGGTDPDPTPTEDGGQLPTPGEDAGTDAGTTPGTDAGTDAGTTEPDRVPVPGSRNPTNATIDSDCDGLTDAEEWGNLYPGVAGSQKTDPGLRDSDGDGVRDGVEVGRTSTVNTSCTFVADTDPSSKTNPTNPDTDGDGLGDGLEDGNRNGKLDPGETDPANPETDGDGLRDAVEDANQNGVVDGTETDPRKRDTDEDGLSDSTELNTTNTNPRNPDMDGDTCKDGAEDKNGNGAVDPGETNAKLGTDCGVGTFPDSDGDGVPNHIEDSNNNGVQDGNETNANSADTDGDGLRDGAEDKNRNGIADSGETDPRTRDTDCDGLADGANLGTFKGEDLNANGVRDTGETSPTLRDSDGDGLLDGVERGVATAAAPSTTCGYSGDVDPTTMTDPLDNDSDNDGIPDGAEDSNQNGQKDPNELDPRNGTDGASNTPAGRACTVENLRQVSFKEDNGGDLRLALRPTFQEVRTLQVGGTNRGLIGYDDTHKVAFIAYKRGQVGASTTAVGDEQGIRAQFNPAVAVGTSQTFTTWDGFPALQAIYDQSATTNLRDYANSVATQLVGTGAGTLTGGATTTGPYKLQVQYVHRSDSSVVVVVAITPASRFVEPGLFVMGDTAGGTALAQFGDPDSVQCETFTTGNSMVDFLFVVDDSGSMQNFQNALGQAGTAIANRLSNSVLDWRIALVSSSFTQRTEYDCTQACPSCSQCNNFDVFRGFTNDISQFQKWLTIDWACAPPPAPASEACWVGIWGSGIEQPLGSGKGAVNYMTNASTPVAKKWRPGARLVVILLTDARDQTPDTQDGLGLQNIIAYYRGSNPTGQPISVHGIICDPASSTRCSSHEDNTNPRHLEVIQATGGIFGLINSPTSIQNTINSIMDSAIAGSGYRTLKPPIGASVRVALDGVLNPAQCNASDLPRGRANGFDVDGVSRALAFYGACRPASVGATKAAVSYRAWSDLTPNVNGTPPPCSGDTYYAPADPDFCAGKLTCNRQLNRCECPADCGGGGAPGQVCNTDRNVCSFTCASDCAGACGSFQECNMATCSCQCVQSASCAPGFKYSAAACACVCDTASLNCGDTYQPDANACACVCKANCGGTCGAGTLCNQSTCRCEPKLN
ncbi:adventurous gliding motility lipoprotein CglD [Archangium sp.]|uniref:adventurous gliding motility lipoprotein CglD n=1 Tax=Archangium sp. TaxID=1872627 RepID=UPI00286C17CF|nr:adventurous gliding motility lipoprotein CglD [Archangium sp.]